MTPQQVLELNSRKSAPTDPDEKRHDSSSEASRELLTEWVATYVDDRKIATAKQIVNESGREDVDIGDVGRTLGCRNVDVTPGGFLDEVELSKWGDANVTSWVFERVDGAVDGGTQTRGKYLFKPDLVSEISDAVGDLDDEYDIRQSADSRRIGVSAAWKRAVTLALVERADCELEELLTGYDEEHWTSVGQYVDQLSKAELTNLVEGLLDADDALGTGHCWPREMLIAIHDVLVSGIDLAEVAP
ncbi:hypothetical protein [Halorubrum trueperi]|uniref:hypothetical protein n=1 Tax=Halorubrum trueperi TaxID=2004704 RepID=UPI0036D2EEE7